MQDVFLLCLAIGAGVLVVQTVLGLAGSGDANTDSPTAGDGLDLLSVRSLAAATMLFGAVGLWLNGRGLLLPLTLVIASIAGVSAAIGTAWATRQMLRLESDGSLRLENAVGQPATVYLPVPAHREGFGMVQFQLQGRTVELRAVADEAAAIPTGTPVIVVSVMEDDTVEVAHTPLIEGIDA